MSRRSGRGPSPGPRVGRTAWVGAIVLLVGLSLAGCGSGSDSTSATQALKKSAADNGQAVTMSQGQQLQVQLEGNPTTGYTWQAQDLPAILAQQGDPGYVSGSTALGSGGVFTFTFTGAQAGEGKLTLVYHRTFEVGVPPAKTFTLQVTVK